MSVGSISPNTLKAGTSTTVTIKGTGFVSGATTVTFVNGQGAAPEASAVAVSDPSTITATVSVGPMSKPPAKDRVWDVVVTVGGVQGILKDGFTVLP